MEEKHDDEQNVNTAIHENVSGEEKAVWPTSHRKNAHSDLTYNNSPAILILQPIQTSDS
jgi:hypothetical protein